MKIVQFTVSNEQMRLGVLNGENVVDLNANDDTIPYSLVELLSEGHALQRIQRALSASTQVHNLTDVRLLSPIIRPDKVLGVALNYKEACDKSSIPRPKEPIAFCKFASTIIGPNDDIRKPLATKALDWEVELVVVIGKKAQHVKIEDAMDYVFGYTCTQDLTAKDWTQRNGGQLLLCKNMDDFCPLGPCVVTKDEIDDPHNIRVKTWVNRELKQDGNTEEMVHRIDKLVEYLSGAMTLLPGDIICTGTPSGIGSSQNPPQYLQKGDLLESEVEFVGKMANHIV